MTALLVALGLVAVALLVLFLRRRRAGGLAAHALTVRSARRRYLLHRPAGLARGARAPCLIAFHGGGAGARRFARRFPLGPLAARHGFLVAFPEADGNWQDGRPETGGEADADLAFVEALIERLVAREGVDPDRIWALGVSNGGMFCLRLASVMGGRFAAVVAALASRPVEAPPPREETAPVPLMLVHGADDEIVPFEGGRIAKGAFLGVGGQVIGVGRTVAEWVRRHRCGRPHVTRYLREGDGAGLTLFDYRGSERRARVVLLVAEACGHGWPRGTYRPAEGRDSGQVRTAGLVWRFLARHAGLDALTAAPDGRRRGDGRRPPPPGAV